MFKALFAGRRINPPGNLTICWSKPNGKGVPVVLPADDRFRNILILGPDEQTTLSLRSMVIQDLKNPEWGLTFLTPTNEIFPSIYEWAKQEGRKVVFFNPTNKDCPKFNPLAGNEEDVVWSMVNAFKKSCRENPEYLFDLNEDLLQQAVRVLKRLDASEGVEGKYATLIQLNRLLQNLDGAGRDLVFRFSLIPAATERTAIENAVITDWFLNRYFPPGSKIYIDAADVRFQETCKKGRLLRYN